jgi:hypothetical protein
MSTPTDAMSRTPFSEAQAAGADAEPTGGLRFGSERVSRLVRELNPGLGGAVVLAGAVVAIGLTAALVRGRRRARWVGPQRPSAVATVAKTAGLWVLRSVVRRVAEEAVARLAEQSASPHAAPAPSTSRS